MVLLLALGFSVGVALVTLLLLAIFADSEDEF
jgi:hypothetical protein